MPSVEVSANRRSGRLWGQRWVRLLASAVVVALGASLIIFRITGAKPPTPPQLVDVRGVAGLARAAFFDDPTVKDRFAANNLQVSVTTSGSRAMAQMELSKLDFAIPGDTLPANYIVQRLRAGDGNMHVQTLPLYSSPIVVASFRSIAEKLMSTTPPVVTPVDNGHYYRLDMTAYLNLVSRNTRWSDLPGNDYKYSTSVLIYTSDPCDSNSAGMYIAIASYLYNNRHIVEDDSTSQQIAPLFTRQGNMLDTTGKIFERYRNQRRDTVPLALIYEHEFLHEEALHNGSIADDMVLMYPDPGINAEASLVAIPRPDGSNYGEQVAKLLRDDPVLKRRAAEFGYRVDAGEETKKYLQQQEIALPPGLGGPELLRANINSPAFEVLDRIIQQARTCKEPAK